MNRAGPATGERRLGAVASLVPRGARVADVGTDRGLLPRILLAGGRASYCIGTEVRRGPGALPTALDVPGRFRGLLEFRSGFGLQVLRSSDAIDVLVLSGLGARTVVRILEDRAPEELGIRRIVIQPQSEPARVRCWLFDHSHAIVAERMVRERGRYYVAIAAEPRWAARAEEGFGPEHPRLERAAIEEAGPCLVRSGDPLVRAYWERVARHQRRILARGSSGAGRVAARLRLEAADAVLRELAVASQREGR